MDVDETADEVLMFGSIPVDGPSPRDYFELNNSG